MRIAGIVAEYNPFHNGHAHHIRETRALSGCDYVVVCMAGHFTQRGEPAILSKWDRVRMALSCGADAVFELPAAFAVRPADAFALGGVGVLGGIGVDVLSFGTELDDLPLLNCMAALKTQEPEAFSEMVRLGLISGKAHARAWGEAAGAWLGVPPETLNQPNLVLASEYLRVMKRRFPDMEPLPVKRVGEGYHGRSLGEYASASAIRGAMASGRTEEALRSIPEPARAWARPDRLHGMDDLLLYRMRGMSPEELRALPGMGEGLEHRLCRLCRETPDRETLLDALKCKRYTRARLSRLLLHALLGITQAELEAVPEPTYARLLGMRADAGPLLRELKDRARLPIVSGAAELKGDPCFDVECRATDLWSLLHDEPALRRQGREFRERFISLE